MMIRRLSRWIPLFISGICAAHTLAAAEPGAPRAMTPADIADWKQIQNAELTPDGAWLIYLLAPAEGSDGKEATVVMRGTRDSTEHRFPAGDPAAGAGKIQISGDGRWFAFIRSPAVTPAAAPPPAPASPDAKPPHTSAVLVEIATARETVVSDIRAFAFNGSRGDWIALHGFPEGDSPGAALLLRRLGTDTFVPLNDVGEFLFNPEGSQLAWSTQTHDGINNALQVRNVGAGASNVLDLTPRASYLKLSWSAAGRALAAIRGGKAELQPGALLVCTGIGGKSAPRKSVFTPASWNGFPAGREIDPTGKIDWREDEKGLFFSVRATEDKAPMAASIPETPAQLRIWHWKTVMNPWQQEYSKLRPGMLSYVALTDGQYRPLGDETLKVSPHRRGCCVVGVDGHGEEGALNAMLTGRSLADYFLIDLSTGRRTLAIRDFAGVPLRGLEPVLSPDGSTAVYYQDGHYHAYDVAARQTHDLTAGLPVFHDEGYSRNVEKALDFYLTKLVGWTPDGRYVLISDHFDLWALPRRAGDKPVKLTQGGREERVRYDFIDEDGEKDWQSYGNIDLMDEHNNQRLVDLRKPLYFRIESRATRQTGYARREPGGGMRRLLWEDAKVGDLRRSRTANVIVYSRQTAVDCPDYQVTDASFHSPRPITDANPVKRELRWSPGARFLTYTDEQGRELHASLFLPADYQPGRKYPTVVMIYEQVSEGFHRYRGPSLHGSVYPNIPQYSQHGYALLMPDIVPRADEAGASAVDGVLAGVKAAVATGVVDADRLGLCGQSYGGFETSFITTQTNMFKAAAAIDEVSDLRAHSLMTYGTMDGPPAWDMSGLYLVNQLYMTHRWWEDPEAYARSSAVNYAKNVRTPLLMRQNDRDYATPFFQGMEYFNTLRGMGKPVVLLQYAGGGHSDNHERVQDSDDLARRMLEFFDHFLQGAAAPSWWTRGIP